MRKLLPLLFLLAGCAGTSPEITAKSEELQSLRNQVRTAKEGIRELPALAKQRQELQAEKASLLQRKKKAGQK